jgi:protease-4
MNVRFASGLALLAILAMIIGSCVGCSGPSTMSAGTKILDFVPNFKPSPPNKIVVHKFVGEITPTWAYDLENSFKDEKVAAVVMWIESGGGSVTNARLLAHNLQALRDFYHKKLYIYSERALFSGAYFAAVEADSIIVAPSGMVGSIGVILQRVDATGLDSALGLKVYTFVSGALKAVGDPHTKMSEIEFNHLSQRIKQIYLEFLSQVYSNRVGVFLRQTAINTGTPDTAITKQMIVNMADGRIFSPYEAKVYGFVDGMDYFDDMVLKFKSRGCIVVYDNGEPIGLFYQR